MKPLVLFQPNESRNEYAEQMYFRALLEFCADNSIPVARPTEFSQLEATRDSTILINGDYLTPERISQLKDNGNLLASFDINDNSALSGTYREAGEILQLDLIFKIGGIQKQNQSQDLWIDQDFNFPLKPRDFLPEPLWNRYSALKDASKLHSLPYVPWRHHDAPNRPYSARSGKVLVRGGNHFYRFMTFLNLARIGRIDPRSSFVTADYFRRDMNPQFRNCEGCIGERENSGKSSFNPHPHFLQECQDCSSPARWGGEHVEDLETYETANHWNNRCPRSFFWLTEQFEKKHGPVDHPFVERALNGSFQSTESFYNDLVQATFYTDLKWLFSIYCPPRFWEAANAGTLNLMPRRTLEQDYFPVIEPGVHYLSYLEDFSDLSMASTVDEAEFNAITEAAREAFLGWIKPGRYPISERLCRHILTLIESKS